jgi:hypothetical protein
MTAWAVETAADGLGNWLVQLTDCSDVWVIAPPGVALAAGSEIAGWRLGYWGTTDGRPASLDSDRPWTVRAITTREVLDLLPTDDHQFVLDTLLAQLAAARSVAMPRPGEAIMEDLARIGAQAAAWAESELAEAFPHGAWPQPDSGAPFPLGPLTGRPEPHAGSEPAASATATRRPQPLGGFLADWLRWLLERHLPGVYTAARRRHLLVGVRDAACTAPPACNDRDACRESDTGELALL